MTDAHVLVADDQPDVTEALRLLLKGEGFQIETSHSPADVLGQVERSDFDAIVMDLNYTRDTTSGKEGLDLLSQIRDLDPELPVIVMTAWGSVEGAVEAMRRGARDYIEKPWDNDRLIATLKTQVELGRALRRTHILEEETKRIKSANLPEFIAESGAMAPVLDVMRRIAPSEANVLIRGEHGTGKEVVAHWLHAASNRSDGAFIAVNAGGFSEGVFESELFGHVKGAFTDAKADRIGCFELADGGSLFLDEIANITLQQQAKLLRALESGEIQRVGSSKVRKVDVRVISATNADLETAVQGGEFREDLLYRLNTVEIHLPPLRDRGDDIVLLAKHFLDIHLRRYGRRAHFTPGAVDALLGHSWPGNVRELGHAVERGVLMAPGDEIREVDLGLRRKEGAIGPLADMTLDDAERLLVVRALERSGGNVSKAAEALGLSRSAMYRRLQRFGLGEEGSEPDDV